MGGSTVVASCDTLTLARDLTPWMKDDPAQDSWFTTMVDFYRLPLDFPTPRSPSSASSLVERIDRLETAFAEDISRQLGSLPVGRRFIPYVQMHEFEALLFSQPEGFAEAFPGDTALVAAIKAIGIQFATPEHIDDGPATAPLKRIVRLAPDYEKVTHGLLVAERIGLGAMGTACPRFEAWIARLFALGEPAA